MGIHISFLSYQEFRDTLIYNFEVYTGQENASENRTDIEPNLGASANVVM